MTIVARRKPVLEAGSAWPGSVRLGWSPGSATARREAALPAGASGTTSSSSPRWPPARALLLTADQHRHLRELAGLPPPEPLPPEGDLLPRLQLLVDSAAPSPASVYDSHFDYLVWNEPYVRVRHDPGSLPAGRRNMLWMMFTDPGNRARMVRWESAARAVLSQFRAVVGRRPDDPRLAELVAALAEASPQFRAWWDEYPVRYFRPATIGIRHPRAGLITLQMFQLRLVDQPDLVAVIQVPASQASLARVNSLLVAAER